MPLKITRAFSFPAALFFYPDAPTEAAGNAVCPQRPPDGPGHPGRVEKILAQDTPAGSWKERPRPPAAPRSPKAVAKHAGFS